MAFSDYDGLYEQSPLLYKPGERLVHRQNTNAPLPYAQLVLLTIWRAAHRKRDLGLIAFPWLLISFDSHLLRVHISMVCSAQII